MLSYFRWISVSGVWIPIILALVWIGGAELVFTFSPQGSAMANGASDFLVLGLLLIPFIGVHALVISSLIGFGLLLTGQSENRKITLLSALIGITLGSFFLARIYFGTGS